MERITIDYDDYLELEKKTEAFDKILEGDVVIKLGYNWNDVDFIFCKNTRELKKYLEKEKAHYDEVNKDLEFEKKYENIKRKWDQITKSKTIRFFIKLFWPFDNLLEEKK